MNAKLAQTLKFFNDELMHVQAIDEYVIFGSTSLILQGVIDREPGDVDVILSKRAWGALLGREAWTWNTPEAHDPPILTSYAAPITINGFFDWRNDRVDLNVDRLLHIKQSRGGFYVIPVEDALRHKVAAIHGYDPRTEKYKIHEHDIRDSQVWLEKMR